MDRAIDPERPSDTELLIVRRFPVPRSVIWRMWSDPAHLIRWWGPEGFTVTNLDMDFRPGGAWRVGMVSDEFGLSWSRGHYSEIDPEQRIVMTFAWEQESGLDTLTTITVGFEERDGETIQTFHQTPFSTTEYRDSHIGGWHSLFNDEGRYAASLVREART